MDSELGDPVLDELVAVKDSGVVDEVVDPVVGGEVEAVPVTEAPDKLSEPPTEVLVEIVDVPTP